MHSPFAKHQKSNSHWLPSGLHRHVRGQGHPTRESEAVANAEIHMMVLLHSFSSRVTQINTCLRSTHSAALMQYKNAQHEQNSKSRSLLSLNYVTEMTIPGDCNDYDHNLRESRFRSIENGRKWLCDFGVVITRRSFYAYYVPELRICGLGDWKALSKASVGVLSTAAAV